MKTAIEIKQAYDPDLYVNMLANDPARIARAKAKRTRVMRAAAEPKKEAMAPETAILAVLSAFGLYALILVSLV